MNLSRLLVPTAPEIPGRVRRLARDATWTISNERVFMEDLVYKRMTSFLVVAGALVTGAINLHDSPLIAAPMLAVGTGLCWAFQQTISRAQRKLDVILTLLFADNDHPVGYVNTIVGDAGRVKWVGHLVPKAICLLLTVATVAEIVVWTGWVKA